MKKLKIIFLVAALLCSMALRAEEPEKPQLFDWSLLHSGSWEEFSKDSGTLHNRGEFKVSCLPVGLTLRGQVLDRRQLWINPETPLGDPDKALTHFMGGLYHQQTGSRFLYGVLDEWGLSARLRNPWIRSPPFAENRKPLIADLKTAASSTKEDEVYLYLSSPFFNLSPTASPQAVKLRGFITAQMEVKTAGLKTGDVFSGASPPAIGGGIDLKLPRKSGLSLESFFTGTTLPPQKSSSWFSDPPRLPQRDFKLYSAGALYYHPWFSVSSDFAVSETFAYGTDIYCNLGVSAYLPVPWNSGRIAKPLTVSLAADGAGERFVYRDGADHGEGVRTAAKVELKSARNGLLRLHTTVRGQKPGEHFNRSNTGIYYRFPYPAANQAINPVRLTRVSITADRNAVNPQKIADKLSGNIGLSVNLSTIGVKTPFGINFSGSITGESASEDKIRLYPVGAKEREVASGSINGEITWSPLNYQCKTKVGFTKNSKDEKIWGVSASFAARFKYGRVSLKANSPDFPQKWDWTLSWRAEKPMKK